MVTIAVEYACDWNGCDALHETKGPPPVGATGIALPEPPIAWVKVDDRLYCGRHQVFIRERDEDAPWSSARWVEERPPK